MIDDKEKQAATKTLRQRALEHMERQQMPSHPALAESDAQKQLHELQVHQVELEMQNAELQQARADNESNLARYTDLYDFAPIGYFSLNREGAIMEVNLTGARLLGHTRLDLTGRRLEEFVSAGSRADFRKFLHNVLQGHDKEIRELSFIKSNQCALIAHVEATSDNPGEICRLVMLDITERKNTEEALRHSREMLRNLVAHQEHVKENERKRISREIHDDLGQNLLALRIDIAMLHERTLHNHPKLNQRAAAALQQLDMTMKAVRTAINNLRPTVLDLGLNAAIEWQVQEFQQRSGIRCDLRMSKEEFALSDECATAMFRILQESLNNVLRHAQASQINIEIRRDDGRVFMSIADNGIGFFPECRRKANSFGLLGIAERVNALKGELTIDSNQNKGTTLNISLPVKKEHV